MPKKKADMRKAYKSLVQSGEIEVDYEHKLNKAEKDWLAKFNAEYHMGLYDQDPDKRLHKNPEHIKESRNRVKQRERDVYAYDVKKTILDSKAVGKEDTLRASKYVAPKKQVGKNNA